MKMQDNMQDKLKEYAASLRSFLAEKFADLSAWLKEYFGKVPGVENVTGMGLMVGIKTKKTAAEIVREAIEKGVLCLTAKDKVRLLPALNIPWDVLKEAAEILRSCIEA